MSLVLAVYTFIHIAISLVGIFSGFVVVLGLLTARMLDGWTATFLTSTVLTSMTGFFFPYHGFLPSYGLGIISMIVLAVAIFARYQRHLAGGWRLSYVVSSVIALYLNVFVLIVQLFRKVPALKAIAPTQTEAPFKITQLIALVFFLAVAILASIRFGSERLRAA